jgi:hypothetical protein
MRWRARQPWSTCRLRPRRRDGLERAFRGLPLLCSDEHLPASGATAWTPILFNYSIWLVAGAGIEPATYGL